MGLTPDQLTKTWRETVDGLGIGDLRYHDLRHSYATVLIQRGMNIKDISGALGHAKTSTTLDIYAHQTERLSELLSRETDAAFNVPPEKLGSASVQELRSAQEGAPA